MPNYPQHEKARALEERRLIVQEFIDWLIQQRKLVLAEWLPATDWDGNLMPDLPSQLGRVLTTDAFLARLIAGFLGIDYDAFLAEKEQMYHDLVAAVRGEPLGTEETADGE